MLDRDAEKFCILNCHPGCSLYYITYCQTYSCVHLTSHLRTMSVLCILLKGFQKLPQTFTFLRALHKQDATIRAHTPVLNIKASRCTLLGPLCHFQGGHPSSTRHRPAEEEPTVSASPPGWDRKLTSLHPSSHTPPLPGTAQQQARAGRWPSCRAAMPAGRALTWRCLLLPP